MLRHIPNNDTDTPRNLRRERRLWHDADLHTPSLGCTECPQLNLCGGLRIAASLYDCMDFCCGKPEACTNVCRNHPDFPDRVREIDGFALHTVGRAAALPVQVFPRVIPVLYHDGKRRDRSIAPSAVALSLYQMFNRRDGSPRFTSREVLCAAYGIAYDTRIILTGTDKDPPLERWWGLGASRRGIIRTLREIGVMLTTTPNYSLFIDVPRWDDLHSMKRIALVHYEFLDEGMPAALHVNARTETDFRRWTEYVAARSEVSHLAYEFTTGTGWAGRRKQHAAWLSELAAAVGRPLNLIVRGGVNILPVLTEAFASVSVLDTSVFMKTMMRQRAVHDGNACISWRQARTAIGAPLDALFRENLETVESWHEHLAAPEAMKEEAARR